MHGQKSNIPAKPIVQVVLVPIEAVRTTPLISMLIEVHKRLRLERLTKVVKHLANWNQVHRVVSLGTQPLYQMLDVRRGQDGGLGIAVFV